MDLPTIWFIIVTYLFAGFLFLEGFDYGVGILSPFISREDEDRQLMLLTIGGVWDGNEVWMISAGAVLFASFPQWYAALFSGMYMILVVMLCGLIVRGVGIKFRNQRPDRQWRSRWDTAICAGSLLAAFLWGVVVGNLLRGIAINAEGAYVGGTLDLLNPFSLATGIALVALFVLHGTTFLNIKLSAEVLNKLQRIILPIFFVTLIGAAAFLAYAQWEVGLLRNPLSLAFSLLAVVALVVCGLSLRKVPLLSFWMSGLAIIAVGGAVFAYLYPRVLISRLDPNWSLTIYNACSSPYTLKVMSVVALFFAPLVVMYQGWTYWVFRKRVQRSDLKY